MNTQILLTFLSGILAVTAAVATIVLRRRLKRSDSAAPGLSADPALNPYAPPSTPKSIAASDSAASDADVMLPLASNSLGNTLLTPIVTVVVGTSVGIVSRLLRPYANVDGTHYEALAALLILMIGCLILISLNRRIEGTHRHALYQLENFAMWSGFACGWSLMNGAFWGDMIAVSFAWCVGCAVFGSASLSALRWIERRGQSD